MYVYIYILIHEYHPLSIHGMVLRVSPWHLAGARLVSSTGYWRRCASTNAFATMKSSLPKAPGEICPGSCGEISFFRRKTSKSFGEPVFL